MILSLLFFGVIAPLICVPPPQSSAALSDVELERVLRIALLNNTNISVAIERINQARADVREAKSRMGPSLTGDITARRNNDFGSVGGTKTYNATLNLIQTIYSGGTLRSNRNAALLALSARKAEGERSYQEVMNSVRNNYYESLRSLAQLQVATESLVMSREHLKQTEALYNAGMVPRGDVLRVRVSVSQSELDRIDAENNLNMNWASLERAVGINLDRAVILTEISGDNADNPGPPRYTVPQNTVELALSRRPEIRAYEFYKGRADQLARSAAGQARPRLNLSGHLGLAGNEYDPRGDDSWYIQLQMEWSLYDGGEIASQIDRAKSAARELLLQITDLSEQIRLEVVQAQLKLDAATTRLDVAEKQVETAKEDYRLALKRYDAQVGTNLDVLDSRAALTESSMAYVNAVYDIAVAQSGLIYAIGEDTAPDNLFAGGDASRKAIEEINRSSVSVK